MSRLSASRAQSAYLTPLLGLTALAAVTLVDRGATKMYAWPWSFERLVAEYMPFLAIILRSFASDLPFRLPPPRWTFGLVACALSTLLSAGLSPWRGTAFELSALPLSSLAWIFLVYDWLQENTENRPHQVMTALAWCGVAFALVSLFDWGQDVMGIPKENFSWRLVAEMRNPHPLGHSNYTGGLCVMFLPWPVCLAIESRGKARLGWALAGLILLCVLATSGSRGGFLGVGASALMGLWVYRTSWRQLLAYGLLAVVAVGLLALANPRIRGLVGRHDPQAAPDESQVQRSAMVHAGLLIGKDHPVLGSGPGTTPLVYPLYRGRVDGGVEYALELHSAPIQVWAEWGGVGLLVLAGLAAMAACNARQQPAASIALAGYFVFSLTDWQLDVPIFAFGMATMLSLLIGPSPDSPRKRPLLALGFLFCATITLLLGRTDPTPALNAEALTLKPNDAVAALTRSLSLNPDQEIANFNLGWLLVTSDPKRAEAHFLAAARLVPDKGGVYLGIALCSLNQGNRLRTVEALAFECLNDPVFITSPWWRIPEFAERKPFVLNRLRQLQSTTLQQCLPDRWPSQEVKYLIALTSWISDDKPASDVESFANTDFRREFFSTEHPRPDPFKDPVQSYYRERIGYPVLSRNLEFDPPRDVYLVQENKTWAGSLAPLFPKKGWLPTPVLVSLVNSELVPLH